MIYDKNKIPITHGAGPVWDADVENYYYSLKISELVAFERSLELIPKFIKNYTSWITGSSLNSFNCSNELLPYVTQAVTQSIESFLLQHRDKHFRILEAEYVAVPHLLERLKLRYSVIENPENPEFKDGDCFILSAPFSSYGDVHPHQETLLLAADKNNVPTFVDCAFWGICQDVQLNLDYQCIQSIAFSPSKTFRLGGIRIGLELSKNICPTIALVNERGYVNRHGAAIAYYIMREFSPDYIPSKYLPIQKEICAEINATPSKTVIFGLGDKNIYKDWNRGGGFHRMCINQSLAHRV
jgi:hypothetical protein